MSNRHSTRLLTACVALIATATLLLPAGAQGQWTVPRTAHGHPDLQGNWSNATITPIERPRGQAAVLTAEEVAQREGRADAIVTALAQPSDPDRGAPEAGSDIGAYNYVYIDGGSRVAIVNGEPRSSLITNPPDGRRPALTPEGEKRRNEVRDFMAGFSQYDNPENRTLADRCLVSFGSHGGPPMTPNYGYNGNYTIVQTADYLMIHYEMVHDTRIIRLGEPDPLPDHMRPWFGDSWGHWEGNTLIVETTNIHPLQNYATESIARLVAPGIWGVRPTMDLKVTERFTRTDQQTILYEFTVDDPTTYTQTWGGEVPFTKYDDLLYEYNCHEGNYAMSNILSGARYQERQGGGN